MLPLVYFQHGTARVACSNQISYAELSLGIKEQCIALMYDIGWNERNNGLLRQVKKEET